MSSIGTYSMPRGEREQLTEALDAPVFVQAHGEVIELPSTAGAAVRHLLSELASGAEVHVLTGDTELTTQQAADLLGLSRTYLVRLVDQGTIPAHLTGTHRRLYADDVIAYQTRRESHLAAVAEVTQADVAAGAPYR